MKSKINSLEKLSVQSFVTNQSEFTSETVKGGMTTLSTEPPKTNMLDCTCIPPFPPQSVLIICIGTVGGTH